MSARRARVLLIALAGWLLTGLVVAGPASAHAELVATTPGDGAQLEQAPEQVTLRFTEQVSLGAGYVRVLTSSGDRLPTGEASVRGDTVTLALPDGLGDDGYLVTYRVISADAHPVSGAFGFVVGDAQPVDDALAATADDTDPFVGGMMAAGRWLGYAGLALGIGVPAFLLVCWPAGWSAGRPRRLAEVGAGAIALGAVVQFLFQAPYSAGTGLADAVDPSLLGNTGSSTFGRMLLVRIILALLLFAVLRVAPRRAAVGAGVVLGVALVLSTAAVGHPVAGRSPLLAVAVTTIHVAAMALWIGGLVALLAGLLRPGVRAGELAGALPRWSGIALGSVVALVLTGVVQSVREVGSPTVLFSTTYGWLLIAKLAVLFVVLGAAGVSRVWVQQHLGVQRPRRSPRQVTAHAFAAHSETGTEETYDDGIDEAADARAAAQAEAAVEDLRPFRRSVLLEAGLLAVVLGITAVLTGTAPAETASSQPYAATLQLQGPKGPDGSSVQVTVDPAQSGPNIMHVYLFDPGGRLTQPADVRVTLTEEQQQIGPLDVDLAPAGPGHYSAEGLVIPGAGTWTVAVTVRIDEFTATTARDTFPVS